MESLEPPLPYGSYQTRGRERQELINNPTTPCPIGPCTVTYDELNDWTPVDETNGEPDPIEHSEILDQAKARGIRGPWLRNELSSRDSTPGGSAGEWNHWLSYIAHVLYEKQYPIHTLKHVFVMNIVNGHTTDLLKNQFYADNSGCEPPTDEPHMFYYGTAEYEALLGTRTGAVMAYLVVGAFDRGTHQISQITIENPQGKCLIFRFDIKDLNSDFSPSSNDSVSTGSKRRRTDDDEEYQKGPNRRKSPKTALESYDGPARRTRQATGHRLPAGTIEKSPPY